jgi:hypothetical protein
MSALLHFASLYDYPPYFVPNVSEQGSILLSSVSDENFRTNFYPTKSGANPTSYNAADSLARFGKQKYYTLGTLKNALAYYDAGDVAEN